MCFSNNFLLLWPQNPINREDAIITVLYRNDWFQLKPLRPEVVRDVRPQKVAIGGGGDSGDSDSRGGRPVKTAAETDRVGAGRGGMARLAVREGTPFI